MKMFIKGSYNQIWKRREYLIGSKEVVYETFGVGFEEKEVCHNTHGSTKV